MFSVVPSDRSRNGHRVQQRRFTLNIRKYFIVRVIEHAHRLPGEVLESLSLDVLKKHPDMYGPQQSDPGNLA